MYFDLISSLFDLLKLVNFFTPMYIIILDGTRFYKRISFIFTLTFIGPYPLVARLAHLRLECTYRHLTIQLVLYRGTIQSYFKFR